MRRNRRGGATRAASFAIRTFVSRSPSGRGYYEERFPFTPSAEDLRRSKQVISWVGRMGREALNHGAPNALINNPKFNKDLDPFAFVATYLQRKAEKGAFDEYDEGNNLGECGPSRHEVEGEPAPTPAREPETPAACCGRMIGVAPK
jgi:hypothetical protein